MKLADKYGASWMHWMYKPYSNWTGDESDLFNYPCSSSNLEDCLNLKQVKFYARIYPRAVAGDTVEFSYDPETYNASLEYKPKESCKLPTIIFVPTKWIYTSGFQLEILGDLAI